MAFELNQARLQSEGKKSMKRLVWNLSGIVFAVMIAFCVSACGGGGGTGGSSGSSSNMTQAQVSSLVSLLAGSGTSALASGGTAQGRYMGILEGMPERILKAAGAGNPKIKPETLSVQCNAKGTSCTFSDQFNVPYTCQTGGTIDISGDMTGTGTATMANLSIQIIETINGWTCDGPTVNGDPYVQVNGTYTYPADSMTMTMSGGFLAGKESCQLNVNVNAGKSGGDISGTACGYNLNSTF